MVYSHIMEKNDYKRLEELLPIAPFKSLMDFYYHIIETPLELKMRTSEVLLPYSTIIINRITAAGKDKSLNESRFYSPIEWEDYVTRSYAQAFFVHASILHQTGNYKVAFYYAEK